jgi:hypothetical protein
MHHYRFMNHSRFMKIQYICQLFYPTCFTRLSIPILDIPCRLQSPTYTQRMDRIISCKFSSFSIRDVASRGMLPTPHALRPYNNCFETNLTKDGFGNGGHCFATTTSFTHFCFTLACVQLITFWSFHLCTIWAFLKMWAFILTWSSCRGPPTEVEGLPSLAFFATKPCTSFKCLVNNHLAQYVTM